jgi:hypothetical protein
MLGATLERLAAQTLRTNQYDVVVVVDRSKDAPRKYVAISRSGPQYFLVIAPASNGRRIAQNSNTYRDGRQRRLWRDGFCIIYTAR